MSRNKKRAAEASVASKRAPKDASSKGPKKRSRAPVRVTCTATKRNGKPCGLPPIKGGTVCHKHGGSAPQVRAKANERLRAMVLPALGELRKIIDSPDTTDADKLRAINMVLNRTGYNERHAVDIGLREPTPWDNLQDTAFRIVRGVAAVVDEDDEHAIASGNTDDLDHYNLESRRNANREIAERETYLPDLDSSDVVVGRVVEPGLDDFDPLHVAQRTRQRSNRPSEFDPYRQGENPANGGTRRYEAEE